MKKNHLLLTLVALSLATTSLWALPTYIENGKLTHAFTVDNQGNKVYFSQGNLQYIGSASTPYWKFAEEQYEYFGQNGQGGTSAQNVDRDLFGYGTKDNPWNTSTNTADYSWHEWGELAISNGGNTENFGWRTLDPTEWPYLVNTRAMGNSVNGTLNARYTEAKILTDGTAPTKDICGLIIFPDNANLTTVSGVTWGAINSATFCDGKKANCTRCTTAGWTALQNAGCIFLPAEGWCSGPNAPGYVNDYAMYWSSSQASPGNHPEEWANKLTVITVSSNYLTVQATSRYMRCNVRLVKDIPDAEALTLRPTASVASAPSANNLTYTGSSQYLITAAGTATCGNVRYRLGTSGDWSANRPMATNAGNYTVQWFVEANYGCYLDKPVATINVTIKRRTVAAPSPMPTIAAATSLTYNGSAQNLVTKTGSIQSGYTVAYSIDGGNTWSTTIPKGTNVGNYTVRYKFYKGDNEEYVPSPNTVNVNIAKANPPASLPESTISIPYDGAVHTLLEVNPVADCVIWYKLGDNDWTTTPPTGTDAGDYSVQYKIVPNDAVNYNTIGPNTVTVTILDYPTVYDVNVDPTAKLTELLNTTSDLKVKRTIYADGEYNTICLPFSLDASALAASPLAGFDRLKTFRGAKVTGTAPDLSIDILVEDATTIEAGIPYLMTYPVGDNIVDPVFHDVTVTTTTPSATAADGVTFQGMFAQVHIDPYASERDEDYLFLGANSQLMWPASSQTDSSIKMRGFRAYFIIDRSVITPALAPKGTRARIVDAPKTATGIENASATFGGSEKILENGVLYIIRNGVRYNAQGQIVE